MELTSLIVTLIVGAIAGWLAGVLVEGAGFGLLINMLLGIAGAFVAAFLFPRTRAWIDFGGWPGRGYRYLRTRRDCSAPSRQFDKASGELGDSRQVCFRGNVSSKLARPLRGSGTVSNKDAGAK